MEKRNMTTKSTHIVNDKKVEVKEEGKVKRITVKVATKKAKEKMKVVKNQMRKVHFKAKKIKQ